MGFPHVSSGHFLTLMSMLLLILWMWYFQISIWCQNGKTSLRKCCQLRSNTWFLGDFKWNFHCLWFLEAQNKNICMFVQNNLPFTKSSHQNIITGWTEWQLTWRAGLDHYHRWLPRQHHCHRLPRHYHPLPRHHWDKVDIQTWQRSFNILSYSSQIWYYYYY